MTTIGSIDESTDDERARRSCLRYAAATMHHVRRIRRRINELDPTQSLYEKQEDFDPEHPGSDPIGADVEAQRFLEAVVRCNRPDVRLGEVTLLGEEVSRGFKALDKDSGHLIVRCDPIDGTSN